jgi:hypothetical protein
MKLLPALFLTLIACSGAPNVVKTPGAARAEARASVELAKDAWVTAATACLDVAKATMADNGKCGVLLTPAHDAIVDAAVVVDTMAPGDLVTPSSVACNLQRAALAILKVPSVLPDNVGAVILPLLTDLSVQVNKFVCEEKDASQNG